MCGGLAAAYVHGRWMCMETMVHVCCTASPVIAWPLRCCGDAGSLVVANHRWVPAGQCALCPGGEPPEWSEMPI